MTDWTQSKRECGILKMKQGHKCLKVCQLSGPPNVEVLQMLGRNRAKVLLFKCVDVFKDSMQKAFPLFLTLLFPFLFLPSFFPCFLPCLSLPLLLFCIVNALIVMWTLRSSVVSRIHTHTPNSLLLSSFSRSIIDKYPSVEIQLFFFKRDYFKSATSVVANQNKLYFNCKYSINLELRQFAFMCVCVQTTLQSIWGTMKEYWHRWKCSTFLY